MNVIEVFLCLVSSCDYRVLLPRYLYSLLLLRDCLVFYLLDSLIAIRYESRECKTSFAEMRFCSLMHQLLEVYGFPPPILAIIDIGPERATLWDNACLEE
jgi:hypothetical protein